MGKSVHFLSGDGEWVYYYTRKSTIKEGDTAFAGQGDFQFRRSKYNTIKIGMNHQFLPR